MVRLPSFYPEARQRYQLRVRRSSQLTEPFHKPSPNIPLDNQSSQVTNLAGFRGRIVIMADFMTSCQEERSITTGALLTVEQNLAHAHLLKGVEIVEVTVDAWRDTPSRIRAYQKTFGVHWTMLTGSVANVEKFGRSSVSGTSGCQNRILPTSIGRTGSPIRSTSTTPTTRSRSTKMEASGL